MSKTALAHIAPQISLFSHPGGTILAIPDKLLSFRIFSHKTLAKTYSYLILAVLMALALSQGILFFLFYFTELEEIKDFLKEKSPNVILFFDNLASNYAIPIGFLGTVTSLWISLELNSTNYNNFGSFLSILKLAVFNYLSAATDT